MGRLSQDRGRFAVGLQCGMQQVASYIGLASAQRQAATRCAAQLWRGVTRQLRQQLQLELELLASFQVTGEVRNNQRWGLAQLWRSRYRPWTVELNSDQSNNNLLCPSVGTGSAASSPVGTAGR